MANTRISQEIVEAPYIGTPKLRISQEIVEVPHVGSPKTRITQEVLEVLYNDAVPVTFIYPAAVL